MLRTHPTPAFASPRQKKWRTRVVSGDTFQRKYLAFFVWLGIAVALLGGGICIYLLNHNYALLIKSGHLTNPKLVDGLERELWLTNRFLFGVFGGLIVFLFFAGMKITHKIVAPLLIIQHHMRELARGNLQKARVRLRKSDEFLDFADSFNYLVAAVQKQTEWDLRRLESLKPDERNRDAYHLWEQMRNEKKSQLGMGVAEAEPTIAGEPSPDPSERHAS